MHSGKRRQNTGRGASVWIVEPVSTEVSLWIYGGMCVSGNTERVLTGRLRAGYVHLPDVWTTVWSP